MGGRGKEVKKGLWGAPLICVVGNRAGMLRAVWGGVPLRSTCVSCWPPWCKALQVRAAISV